MISTKLIRTFSWTLGLASLLALIYVDNEMAFTYNESDGKTKALFGLLELGRFSYKYLIAVPAILGVLFSISLVWRKQFRVWDIGAIIIGLTAIIGAMTSSWRIFI
jgi:hypothetical protein